MVEDGGEARQLVNYIDSLSGFTRYTEIDGNYGHVGAILADAVLQSRNDYEKNVRPRITRIRTQYKEATSLQDLKRLLLQVTVEQFLGWNSPRKSKAFRDLIQLFDREKVNTEDDMRQWIEREGSSAKLHEIHFIGPKTVAYLKILVGLPYAAMDMHLFNFLKLAGLDVGQNHDRGQTIVHDAADMMNMNRAHLDHSIWRYMRDAGAAV